MSENIYFKCRKQAALSNDRLNSRGGAAEYLGISESSLTHYELGITKNIPADVVVTMAELYNAPELKNYYCRNECPIGKNLPVATEETPIALATVHLLENLNPDTIKQYSNELIKIASDGKVSPDEALQLGELLDALDKITQAASELRILAEKHSKE